MKIAGTQMLVTDSISENRDRIIDALDQAAAGKVDFLITPEGALSGYCSNFDRSEMEEALGKVVKYAGRAHVGLLLGTCRKYDDDNGGEYCVNQALVYTPEGEFLGDYSKILLCTSLDNPGSGEMAEYRPGKLKTFVWKNIRFGVLICNDMWASPHCTVIPNPYLPLQLKNMGVEIIFHLINSGTDQRCRPFHESNVEIRARSLKLHIVECNAAKENGKAANARSGVVLPDGSRPEIVDPVGEQYFTSDLLYEKQFA